MKTYEQALEVIRNIQTKSQVSQNFLKSLTVSDLVYFEKKIRERVFLPEIFKNKICLKSVGVPILFSLFDDNEIENYFIDCCLKFHYQSCQNKWIKPIKSKFFRTILGFYRNIQAFPYLAFIDKLSQFDDYYYNFLKQDIYPNEIVEEIIQNINERKTLQEINPKLKQLCKEAGTRITLVQIIEFSVIPRIGIQKLENYFREITEVIAEESSNLTYTTFSNAIFGNNHILNVQVLSRLKHPCYNLMHSFLTVIFPKILTSYCGELTDYFNLGNFSNQEIYYWRDFYEKNQNSSQYFPGSRSLKTKDSIYEPEVNELMKYYYNQRKIPTKKEILKKLTNPPQTQKERDKIFYVISQKQQELKDYLYQSQSDFFNYESDEWKIYYKYKDKINFNILDFTLIKGDQLREESKKIVLSELKDGLRTEEIRQLLNALSDLEMDFKIKSFNDIKAFHLISYYHMLETNGILKPTSLRKVNQRFKLAFEYQIRLGLSKDNINVAKNIFFSNVESYYKKTQTIPEGILSSLLNLLAEAPIQVNLVFRLLLETGWRFNEIARLTPESFKPIEAFPDYIQVSTILSKTASSRINNGLGEILTGFITKELYRKIEIFLEETSLERDKYSIDTCFYSLRNGVCERITTFYFNYNIKQLIEKHNITDENGKLWSFSSRQLRKTTTVELIDAGIPLTSVQKQLGHLHTSTTEKYYAEVNTEHLKDKNNQFFSKTVFSDKDKTGNKEVRLLSDLEVPVKKLFGSCLHPFSETLCPKIKEFKCFECSRFYSCNDYKSELTLIKNSLEELLNELIDYYEEKRIVKEEYSKSEEFKVIQSQLRAVTDLLERINA